MQARDPKLHLSATEYFTSPFLLRAYTEDADQRKMSSSKHSTEGVGCRHCRYQRLLQRRRLHSLQGQVAVPHLRGLGHLRALGHLRGRPGLADRSLLLLLLLRLVLVLVQERRQAPIRPLVAVLFGRANTLAQLAAEAAAAVAAAAGMVRRTKRKNNRK